MSDAPKRTPQEVAIDLAIERANRAEPHQETQFPPLHVAVPEYVAALQASLTTALAERDAALEVARRAEANSRQDFQAHEKAEAELCAAETERDEARRQLGERDEMLLRWLTWEGRSDDTASPIEAETAKMLGHTEECELVEYGVCTCERATIPTPSPPPEADRG